MKIFDKRQFKVSALVFWSSAISTWFDKIEYLGYERHRLIILLIAIAFGIYYFYMVLTDKPHEPNNRDKCTTDIADCINCECCKNCTATVCRREATKND